MSSLRQPPAPSTPSLRDRMTNSLRGWITGLPARERANPGAAPASTPAPAVPGPLPVEADAPRPAPPGFVFRDGGQVPGRGEGDKVPALYEPGEFVVSNDMLNQAPGLRESLHNLRAQTLAAQGKTVAEADAGVMRGKALQARSGFESQIPTDGYPPAPAADGSQDDPMNTEAGRNLRNLSMAVPGSLGAGRVAGAIQAAATTASAPQRAITAARTAAAAAAPAIATPAVASPSQAPGAAPRPAALGPQMNAPGNTVQALRQPNGVMSFSGEDVKSGFGYSGDSGFKPSGAGVTSMPAKSFTGLDPSVSARLAEAGISEADLPSNGGTASLRAAPAPGGFDRQHLAALAFSEVGTPGRKFAQRALTSLMEQDGAVRSTEAAAKVANSKALRDQFNKDRDFAASRADKAFEQGTKMDEQARAAFKNRFTKVVDGKAVERPDLEHAAYASAVRASGGKWSQLSPAERAQRLSDAGDYVDLLSAARDRQNNGWLQAIGWDPADPRIDQLPDLAGSRLETVGAWEGMRTPNTEGGDYALRLNDGRTMYLARDQLGSGALAMLKRQGAKIGE